MYKFLSPIAVVLFFFSACKTDSIHKENTEKITLDTLIAYNVLVDPSTYNYDIFVTDLKGSKHQNISNNDCLDWVYSAYNDKLFVISDRDTCAQCYFLYETNSTGTEWKKIGNTLVQDSWVDSRNDGKELIIKPKGDTNTPFEIIDRSGNLIAKVNPEMDYFNDPCFSADGNQIVFRGYNGDLNEAHKAELYIYDLQTKSKRQLSTYPKDGKTFGHFQYYAGPPRWNDIENRISYSSSNNEKSIINSVNTKGAETKKLTRGNIKAIWHDISLDGKWIAFDGQLDFKADSTTSQIFISNFEKRSSRKITSGSGYKQGPVFVYDAKK